MTTKPKGHWWINGHGLEYNKDLEGDDRMTEQEMTYDGCTVVGGWCIPNEELEAYVRQREEMMTFLETTFKAHYKEVYIGGQGSQDGDYISAHDGDKENVFIHFDPAELDIFNKFTDKEDYVEMKWVMSEIERDYYKDGTKEGLEGEALFKDWDDYVQSEYKKRTNKEYPFLNE